MNKIVIELLKLAIGRLYFSLVYFLFIHHTCYAC